MTKKHNFGIPSKDDYVIINGKRVKVSINPEYANKVRPLSSQEYDAVEQSIKDKGLWHAISVNQNGVILDGHHRFKMCKDTGVKPRYDPIIFKDEIDEKLFVAESNYLRRNISDFEKVKLVLEDKPLLEEQARRNSRLNLKQNTSTVRNQTLGRIDELLAKRAGVGRDTFRKAEKIIKDGTEPVIKALVKKEISINYAYNLLDTIRKITELRSQYSKKIEILVNEYDASLIDGIRVTELIRTTKNPEEKAKLATEDRRLVELSAKQIAKLKLLEFEYNINEDKIITEGSKQQVDIFDKLLAMIGKFKELSEESK